MEVKVNNKVRRIWNRKEWTSEMDAVVLRMADGETTCLLYTSDAADELDGGVVGGGGGM